MVRVKKTVCPNCQGQNEKCKYLLGGRACRVSKKTLAKNDVYNKLMPMLWEQYFNFLDIYNVSMEDVSFFKWLRMRSPKTAQKFYRQKTKTTKQLEEVMLTEKEKKELQELDKLCNTQDVRKFLASQSSVRGYKERKQKRDNVKK